MFHAKAQSRKDLRTQRLEVSRKVAKSQRIRTSKLKVSRKGAKMKR